MLRIEEMRSGSMATSRFLKEILKEQESTVAIALEIDAYIPYIGDRYDLSPQSKIFSHQARERMATVS